MLQCPNAHCLEQHIRPADVPFDLHGVVMRSQLLRMLKYRIGFCQLNREVPMPPSGTQTPPTQVQPPLSHTYLCPSRQEQVAVPATDALQFMRVLRSLAGFGLCWTCDDKSLAGLLPSTMSWLPCCLG